MVDKMEKLLNDCNELKMLELKAAELYKDLIHYVTEANDKSILNGIIKDEMRHADIVQQVIDILNQG